MTIKITKQLATVEDLAIGTGPVIQERNGAPLTLTKIDFVPKSEVVIRVTLVSQLPEPSTDGFQALVSGVPYIYKSNAWVPSEGYVTPDGYGAVGDGTTDDSAAIQAALNTEYTVVIPGKNYSFNTVIRYKADGQAIVGRGWDSQLTQGTGTAYIRSNGFDDLQFKD